MHASPPHRRRAAVPGLLLAALVGGLLLDPPATAAPFRAGAHRVDIAPERFPVRVNAMFTERSADRVADPLHARALVLDDGTTRIALCVVDSCMLPRDLIDRAKAEAATATGIPPERMMVSATHTHSAPSAMGCLGSRVDPEYARMVPGRIARAIAGAAARLAPARVAWTAFDDWEHTFNRRWIRRPDRLLEDPFGNRSVRAHMHPGHESPDAVGPSGPVDPGFTLLALSTPEGRPIALLGNYSQHYYGSPLLSSDYFGRFEGHVSERLGADGDFVALLSQGTSGDLMWMDYGAPARDVGQDAYAAAIADRVAGAWRALAWRTEAPLRMAQRPLGLRYRVPDAARLAWARQVAAPLGDRLPATLPEIYALEAIHLHERGATELLLQAVAIGDLGIATLPNEVFALTGLRLKARSPFPVTMNIALANGAEGYIPPPEQHALGGYTTWPARTAGLEVGAEPRIVDTLLSALSELAGRPPTIPAPDHGAYARAVLDSGPTAYWRLDEMTFPEAADATGHGHVARFEAGVALFLPGPGSGTGVSPDPALHPSPFSARSINRAVHVAGGRIRAPAPTGDRYSLEFWVWNGLPHDVRPVTGYLYSHGAEGDPSAPGEHLGVAGTLPDGSPGCLFVFNGNARGTALTGRTPLGVRAWHHVVLVREGSRVRVHLDGRTEPEIDGELPVDRPAAGAPAFLGGRSDGFAGLEGRLDEVALYPRSLAPAEIRTHYRASQAATRPPRP